MIHRSPLQFSLLRKIPPTPAYTYLLALAVAILGGIAASDVQIFAGILVLIVAGLAAMAILSRPVRGFILLVSIYPYYAAFRGLCGIYSIPLPTAVLGLWPEAILTLMLIGVVLDRMRCGERLLFDWQDLPVLLLLTAGVYGAILAIADDQPVAALYGFHTSVAPLCFFFVGRWLRVSSRDLRLVIWFWLINFTFLALASLADYFTRTDFMVRLAIQVRPGYGLPIPPEIFFKIYPRLQSLLYAEQMFGTMCVMVVIYTLTGLDTIRTRWRRFAILLLTLLALICLILTLSRGAYVCFAVALFALLFFRGRHRAVVAMGILCAAVGGILLYGAFQYNPIANALLKRVSDLRDTTNRQNTAYDRVEQWEDALAFFPLFPAGRGLGRVGTSSITHATRDSGDYVADGGYFKILAEQGLPGILMFCAGAFSFPFVLYRQWRSSPKSWKPPLLTLFCVFLGMLAQNIAGNVFDFWYFQHVFWLMAGLALIDRRALLGEWSKRRFLPSRFTSGKYLYGGVARKPERT